MRTPLALALTLISLGATGARAKPPADEYLPGSVSSVPASAKTVRLLLSVGDSRALDLPFTANAGANGIAIGNPQLLTTTLVRIGGKPDQLILSPLRVGHTSVTIRLPSGELSLKLEAEIAQVDLYHLETELREQLAHLENLTVRRVGPLLQVEGQLASPEVAGQLYEVISKKRYESYVVNLTLLSPHYFEGVAAAAQAEIAKFSGKIRVRAVGEQLWLEGEADNLDQARRAERVASLLMPAVLPAEPLGADPKARHLTPRSQVQSFVTVGR